MAVGVAGIGLMLAACSSGSSTTSSASTPSTSTSSTAAAGPASSSAYPSASSAASSGQASGGLTITLTSIKGIPGKFLAGSDGRTIYLFEADKGTKSTCEGACAQAWPPVPGPAKAAAGVKQSLLGTTTRPDGTKQVTYNGHPLYYFAGDPSAGTDHGQNSKAFGAGWYVVAPSGKKIDTD